MSLECEHGQLARACNICEYEREIAELRSRVAEQQTEIERLCELLWGSRCVFCGEVVGKEKKNQDIADEVLRKHVEACPKHPLAVARARIKELEHSLEENGIDFPRADCEAEGGQP